MAKTIRDLVRADTFNSSDFLHLSQGGVDKLVPADKVLESISEGSPFNMTAINFTDINKTLGINDRNNYIRASNAATQTFTLSNSTNSPWLINDTLWVIKKGAGDIVFVGESGVTINPSLSGVILTEDNQVMQLIYLGANTWDLITGGVGPAVPQPAEVLRVADYPALRLLVPTVDMNDGASIIVTGDTLPGLFVVVNSVAHGLSDNDNSLIVIDADYYAEKVETPVTENLLINGDFLITQWNTVQTTTDGYGSDDRWYNSHSGSTKVHTIQPHALGQTDVPGNPKSYSETVVTSVAGASNYVYKAQFVEYVSTLSGRTATLTFYASADSPKNMAVEFVQDFGVGGVPDADVTGIGVTTIPLTTTFQKFTVDVDLPSVSGKTLGTVDDYLGVRFWFDAGSDFDGRTNTLGQQSGTFNVSRVRLREKGYAISNDNLTETETLALCERYLTKSYETKTNPGTLTSVCCVRDGATRNSAGLAEEPVRFSVEMRSTPSLNIYSSTGTLGQIENGGDKAFTGVANLGTKGWTAVSFTGGVASTTAEYHYIASSEILP